MKRKAFTLTELLVVVVIIGVLSAVVLPKFNKMLETRKTTEAEEMLAAVRNEQEARCLLDKPYLSSAQIGNLSSLPKTTTKNFTYALTDDGGVDGYSSLCSGNVDYSDCVGKCSRNRTGSGNCLCGWQVSDCSADSHCNNKVCKDAGTTFDGVSHDDYEGGTMENYGTWGN